MSITVEEFLAHNGVKGMKWGVRKDEDSGASSRPSRQDRRETAAKKFDNKAASYQLTIDILNGKHPKSLLGKKILDNDLKDFGKLKAQALSDADAKRGGKLTSTQKKVLIGAAITAAIVGGAVIYGNAQSGNLNRLAAKGSATLKGKPLAFTKKPDLADFKDSDSVFENVVKGINPNYGSPGTKKNCRRATFAYEMRRRGYDVKATRTTGSTGQSAQGFINAISPGAKIKSTNKIVESVRLGRDKTDADHFTNYIGRNLGMTPIAAIKTGKRKVVSPSSIFDALSKEPDGSRGELAVAWLGGGAHSMAYEIFQGKPVVFDAQSGAKYDSLETVFKGIGHVATAGITRLDNVDLNTDYLNRWLKNAK